MKSGDTLVFAGDVFDLFAGNREYFRNEYKEFLDLIFKLSSQEIEIHYIEGNHDFQLAGVYDAAARFHRHDSQVVIEASGKKFFISHGDLIDRADKKYLLMRTVFRSPFMKLFLTISPDWLVKLISVILTRNSQKKNPRLPGDLNPERRDRLRSLYRDFAKKKFELGFDFVLLGHCHDIDEEKIQKENRTFHYMNIGYPRVDPRYIQWSSETAELSRVSFLTS